MKIWIISGSSSGVGKSTLASGLSEILPRSILIKVGHGQPKADKCKNYFTDIDESIAFLEKIKSEYDHCVIESNRLAGLFKADIVIFLDSYSGDRRADASKILERADIVIGPSANRAEWRARVAELELPVNVRRDVMRVIRIQDEYLAGKRIAVRTKVWFTHDGLNVFGEGHARLLYAVDAHGSLSKAARMEGISYRHAWGDIKKAEERLGFKLLENRAGGKSGGGAKLTAKARKLLEGYETLKRHLIKESDQWFEQFLQSL